MPMFPDPSIGVGTGGWGLGPPSILCIKYAEFILDTPFGPPQSCLRSYASAIEADSETGPQAFHVVFEAS